MSLRREWAGCGRRVEIRLYGCIFDMAVVQHSNVARSLLFDNLFNKKNVCQEFPSISYPALLNSSDVIFQKIGSNVLGPLHVAELKHEWRVQGWFMDGLFEAVHRALKDRNLGLKYIIIQYTREACVANLCCGIISPLTPYRILFPTPTSSFWW